MFTNNVIKNNQTLFKLIFHRPILLFSRQQYYTFQKLILFYQYKIIHKVTNIVAICTSKIDV